MDFQILIADSAECLNKKSMKWAVGILVGLVVIVAIAYYAGWLKFGKISFGN